MRARPFSRARAFSAGMASRHRRNMARTLTPLTRSHCSSVISSTKARPLTPALLNRMSMAPNLRERRRHDLLRRVVAGDVAAEGGDGIVAGMRLLDRRFRPVDRQHLRALVGEQLGRRRADARRRPGHDRDLACQSAHGVLLLGSPAVRHGRPDPRPNAVVAVDAALRATRAARATAAVCHGGAVQTRMALANMLRPTTTKPPPLCSSSS